MSSYAVSERGKNAYRCSLHWSVQRGIQAKCPSLCCMDSTWFIKTEVSCLCLSSRVQPVPYHSNNMRPRKQSRHLNIDQRLRRYSAWSVVCCVHSVRLQSENIQTKTSWNLYQNLILTRIRWKTKTFLLRATLTLMVTWRTLLTQTAHRVLKVHTVNPTACSPHV